ncbi:MAG TPA: non-homologous end-joining DNA ligase, partial [Streptosporangiaceae bacterium]|nr:non-homologous end-joining DNA ligase [Streptosporangiaceae bacterium]
MDPLAEYRRKRDQGRTPEPMPAGQGPSDATGAAGRAARFVVQEHHARRLHWDLRLERGGALVSWALPKGVPGDPAVNHLAVHTEDHPLEYAGFAGEIPRGEYGAGQVTIWDHGTYEAVKWQDSEVKVILHGQRLSGGFALFRTHGDSWMIHRERVPLPGRIEPMLARAADLPPEDGRWAHEMKWDGLRALAYAGDGRVRLLSRTGQDITADYPELAGLGRALGRRQAVLDGEIVVLGTGSWPDFEALQQRMHPRSAAAAQQLASSLPVTYLAFDLLHLDGRPLLDEPYHARRELLDGLGLEGPGWQTPPSFTQETGGDVLAVSRQHGLEGIVSKRLASRYEPGKRTGSWRKIKNIRRQEVVVGGWKPGEGGRTGQIGSLLIGVHDQAGLAYAGHVGTGFSQQALRMLRERLAPLRRDTSPFATPVPPEHARPAVWVDPAL